MYFLIAALIVGALVLWLVFVPAENVEAQRRYITQLEDSNATHPGVYEADLVRERARLARMTARRAKLRKLFKRPNANEVSSW